MWILNCDSDIFQGKRFWLRPGTRHVFGRVEDIQEPGQYILGDKTISRKHVMIDVAKVEPGDSAKTHARSQVTIQDLNTKIGTLHNGASIRGKRVVLEGDKHEIQLGRYPHLLRITWQPVVLTLSFSNKELRADAAKPIGEQLEPLDIKCLYEYVREHTTHVLCKKRNTSKGLQALVNGRYIVQQDSFLSAILAATDPEQGRNNKSQLETDFEGFWPDALNYLPPQGTEPTQLPATAYSPDSTRQNIFEGYSFVFFESTQHNQLLAPITNGGGKAFLKAVNPDGTSVNESVDDFVRYVKDIAGEKGLGEFEDGSEGKGVVVVRFQSKGPNIQWYTDFITQTSQLLDHRPIEQSEFLDAILRNDASVLRRPLEPALSSVQSSSFAQSSLVQRNVAVDTPQVPPKKTGISRRILTSRFKGFDDSDISDGPEETPAQRTQVVDNPASINQASQESGMFMSQREETPAESQRAFSQAPPKNTASRKRPAPPDEELSVMDQLAPATLGFKRRRLVEEAERRERGEPSPPPVAIQQPKPNPSKTKTKKPEKQIDVLEIARQRREEEAAVAEADRAALEASLEDMDINEVRHLNPVEEMEVRSVPPPQRPVHADDSEHWDEKWNGRKNFKKFRRRGQESVRRPAPKVIVELEEVKKKDHGIGDEYWLESGGENQRRKRKGKGKGKEPQSQSASTRGGRPKSQVGWDDDDMDMSDSPPTTSAVSQRSATMRSQEPQKLGDKTNTTRTSQAQNKRPAAAPLKNPVPAKKARPTLQKARPTLQEDDSESDDDTKFKFRKGAR